MIRRALVLAAGLVVMALLGAAPAWAHGGPIAIAVHGDGGQGITATVVYARDGHAVTEQVTMTYTAVSAGGKTVGPLPLTASAEGQSFYISKNPLPVGDWTVTVTATHPSPATQTVSVTSVELPPVGAAASAQAPSSLSTTVLVAIPVAVAAVALAVALVLRRRRLSVS